MTQKERPTAWENAAALALCAIAGGFWGGVAYLVGATALISAVLGLGVFCVCAGLLAMLQARGEA